MSPQRHTPLRQSYEDLPSLGFSSSPLGESPRTVHNHASRFVRYPQSSLPKPQQLTDALLSSPPELHQAPSALGPSFNVSNEKSYSRDQQLSRQYERQLEMQLDRQYDQKHDGHKNQYQSWYKNDADSRLQLESDVKRESGHQPDRRQKAVKALGRQFEEAASAAASAGSVQDDASANRRLSAILSSSSSPLGKRSIPDSPEIVEEYSIMGSNFGFLVDASGRVRLSPLRKNSRQRLSVTREEMHTQILSQDSDSDSEEAPGSNVEGNAVGAFARILTRSRMVTASEDPKQPPKTPTQQSSKTFFDHGLSNSQGSVLGQGPSTPLSTGNFQASIMTPPGALFTFDHPMYSTGMTPYLTDAR